MEPVTEIDNQKTKISERELPFQKVMDVRSRPQLRGEQLLDVLNEGFIRLNQWIKPGISAELNPFAQMGAVANTLFVISLVSGILLLFWYSPSIHHAYESLEALKQGSVLGQFMRSLHRYSSDGMMLFLLLHGLQVLVAGKFSGPRWLAWVSGVVLAVLVWLDGWLGYWLVWDQRAQLVARASAKMLDVLPFFADPLSRSFLTNESVNSLLFFLVFFLHMLIPLGLGIALWIHIMRLNQSVFFTTRRMSAVIFVSLTVISVIYPATSAAKADMLTIPGELTIDWFYLLPLVITEHLKGGTLWVLTLVGITGITIVPWVLVKRRSQTARVLESRCNGCTQCYQDCPYNAITMMPRLEGKGRSESYAVIDPARCVGCGICVGSCDPAGVEYPLLEPLQMRKWVDALLTDLPRGNGHSVRIAFMCAESAGGTLTLNASGESPSMPGFRIVPVPCAGWVHPLLIERAIRKGAAGVLVVSCDADPYCRKGVEWTAKRLAGERKPAFRKEKVEGVPVWHVRLDRTERKELQRIALSMMENAKLPAQNQTPRWRRWSLAAAVLTALALLTVFPSDAPLIAARDPQPEIVVSFKHPGQLVEQQKATSQKDEKLLPHMRGAATLERVRVPVRLRVWIDGREVIRKAYKPGGLFHDGISLAMETIPLTPGRHRIRVAIGDSPEPDTWQYVSEKEVLIETNHRRHVVLFDRVNGFRWY